MTRAACWFSAALLFFSGLAVGQVKTGTPPFGSFGGGPFDTVNLANLNVNFAVPILHKGGRGLPLNYDLAYDSAVWYPVLVSGVLSWQPVFNWGWQAQWGGTVGYITYQALVTQYCYDQFGHITGNVIRYQNWVYHDTWGIAHAFSGEYVIYNGSCSGTDITSFTSTTSDGSGLTLNAGASPATKIKTPGGAIYYPPINPPGGSTQSTTLTDANGNQITSNSSGVFTDTLGTTALTVSGSAPNPTTFSYTPPNAANGPASFVMHYTNKTVKTNFGCSSPAVAEYGPTVVPLVTDITLPDGTRYVFDYERTPGDNHNPPYVTGRLNSVTLPTGGTITYTYSGGNNGIICADGSTAGLTRAVSPGGTWTYSRAQGTGSRWTTTITDPVTPTSNQTVIDFQKDSANNFFETQRLVYQGSAASGTLLKTNLTCYNGNSIGTPANCPTTAVALPITRVTSFTYLPDSNGLQTKTDTFYNSNGVVTQADQYAYGSGGPGALQRRTVISYASLGNNIVDRPSSVTIQNGSGSVIGKTTYAYDETAVTATSGTPQHIAVSGSRGNVTTISNYYSTSALSRHVTYYDTGTVKTATDVNGAVTTVNYGTGSCGNSLSTSISQPLSLSRSTTYNCTGGVATSQTDENGKTTYTNYTSNANFWWPESTQDALGNITGIAYSGQTQVESALNFNSGSSTADGLTILDGLGQTIFAQRKQSPSGNYDSVQQTYDVVGRPYTVTVPYSGAAGAPAPQGTAKTTISYDSLNRPTQTADGGGGTVNTTYTKNDVYIDVIAPTGENNKRRQLEYDALGRLTSVCEVTSASASGACGQTVARTGFLTTYAYDTTTLNSVLVNRTTVTQNAQPGGTAQIRTYLYDLLGRLVKETNPESGSTTYVYDGDAGGPCASGTYLPGNLVKRTDAVGNVTCYSYDQLHRVLSVTYPSGSYAATTPKKYYVYDAATVNGVVMGNAKGRVAEAYTCTTCPGTKITDLGFVYSARGEVIEIWESTPHSGGYYHPTAQYWANGALKNLWMSSLPSISYGADGEGRTSTVSASSGQNPVTSTVYDLVNHKTTVTFGSLDSDVFTFDANTGRMSQYKFNVGSQAVTGNLTWNANGSLKTLAITDQLNASNTQTCNFAHDDLSRISSANCGAPWSQTFSFDPFGNISKTGTISFLPTYNAATNRFQTIPGGTPTYDLNGNLTYDLVHNYTWDVEGKALTIDTVNLTYDALGRMVEQNRSGTYTQIVYSPTGSKMALMSGQTLQKAFVPLSGGATAVYTSSGLAYYRHSDWLGGSRLASTPSRGLYYDVAYAPYGEKYSDTGTQDLNFTGQNQDTASYLYDFLYREYHPPSGRWISPDPAGRAAVDPTRPQTWNRYAYVGNSPCSYIDPLGLDQCDLDIGINNQANLSPDQLTAIEDRINAVLGATQTPEGDSVGVSLTLKGKADYKLKLSNSGPLGTLGVDTSFLWWHRTSVYINSIQAHFSGASSSDLDRIAGTISAHELVHRIAGIGDLPFDPGSPNLMSIDYNPDFDNVLLAQGIPSGLHLTPGQVSDLFGRCRKKHANRGGGAGGRSYDPSDPQFGSWVFVDNTGCSGEGCPWSFQGWMWVSGAPGPRWK